MVGAADDGYMQKGWARSVDVYCTGQDACNSGRTTAATDGIVTPRWKAAVLNPMKTRLMVGDDDPWDLGVIRTAGNVPGPAVALAQVGYHPRLQVESQTGAC